MQFWFPLRSACSWKSLLLLLILSLGLNQLQAQDYDGDGIIDASDNCPSTPNADQIDKDGNGVGDACENPSGTDSDSDEWPDNLDNCPSHHNNPQYDYNSDGLGDFCDYGYPRSCVNYVTCLNGGIQEMGQSGCRCTCPTGFSGTRCQTGSGLGLTPTPSISSDRDDDGVDNGLDNAPYIANSSQTDTDSDGIGDATDNCVFTSNADQADSDANGVGNVCESLVFPVTLLSYHAEIREGKIFLTWVTATETNNDHFIIDKSLDGQNFAPWKKVLAIGDGNSSQKTVYEAWDTEVKNLVFHYYRLRQIDKDGQENIIGLREIDTRPFRNTLPEISLFPNPTRLDKGLKIRVSDPFGEGVDAYSLKIVDVQGRMVYSKRIASAQAIRQDLTLELPSHLSSGLYSLLLNSGHWVKQVSFVLN